MQISNIRKKKPKKKSSVSFRKRAVLNMPFLKSCIYGSMILIGQVMMVMMNDELFA